MAKLLNTLSDYRFFFRHRSNVGTVKTGLKGISLPMSVCFLFCGLVLCDSVGNQVARASNQQSEHRQAGSRQAASGSVTQNNTAKSGGSASPGGDALESLKAFFGSFRVQLTMLVLSGFSIRLASVRMAYDKAHACDDT
jgi:hypothetical protein